MGIQSVCWLGVLVVMLVIELLTMGLTTIWFAGGALAAFAASMLHVQIIWQVILFAAVSLILLIATRPFAVRYINKDRVRTNADRLIGRSAVVTEAIDSLNGQGAVKVAGQVWSARTEEEEGKIPADTVVKILRISGVKLIVEPEQSAEDHTLNREQSAV